MRRQLVGALGSAASVLALSAGAPARAQSRPATTQGATQRASDGTAGEKVFNAYDRTRQFQKGEMSGTPWIPGQKGNFDLADPVQSSLARLKMTQNLVGQRTYIPMLVRLLLGRETNPGGMLLGAAGLFTWQLQVPDPRQFPGLPPGTALMRSMYTARYLDPATMEPTNELLNPYNGKMMELEDSLFVENFLSFPKGGSRSLEEAQFANDDPNVAKPRLIKRWGDELVMFQGGTYGEPGKHQPRFTENMWAASHRGVMDPDTPFVDTRYSFTGVNKAYEKPWAGYTVGDKDILCSLAYGRKVHRPEDIPDFHKRVLIERYPDRL
ncbi:MAG: hypothetical protein MUF07_14160 [Steroidobacteraceae bacterium]|nr:hypothetical protein [Steroidobacteraceae bacterium]